ncbi:MAG: PorT family protein [Bacteroidetes bacterium]|nr:PorT family protein [Bacteroidota bacterium]MCL2303545.1 PorT family protein [Lentimicrobiaceae bacterium]
MKKIIINILFILSILHVSARKIPSEFSIYGGGGFSFFSYQPPLRGASSGGFSADAGMGFIAFFNSQWGIHTGAGFGLYNVKAKVGNFKTITPKLVDCEGYIYDLHTTLNNYSEIQKSIFLTVPLMLQFQTKQKHNRNWRKDKKSAFYVMAGAKALFLIKNDYTSNIASFSNAAYYPDFDNWIATLTTLGLGAFDNVSSEGTLSFNVLAMVALEAGMKWRIRKNLFLYSGVYFDYGLNDPTKNGRILPGDYTTAEYLKNPALLKFTNRINLMTAGIKLRLAFFKPPDFEPCPF